MNAQQCQQFYQSSSTNQGQSYRQQSQTYGGSGNGNAARSYTPGSIHAGRFNSAIRLQQANQVPPVCPTRSSYGMNSRQAPTRAPPVFSSSSSASFQSQQYNRNQQPQQQQRCWNGINSGSTRAPQQRSSPSMQINISGRGGANNAGPQPNNCNKLPHRQMQYQCDPNINQHPLAPAPYCTPQAIKVNVTAEQLESAKNTPIYPDRGEGSQEDNPNAKYIQLNWQDLLGGMENLRVSMVPSPDPNCQNRQLKVSFGGQKTDPPAAGETSLKVVSIEPVNSGRMDIQMGNALAGHMKVCNAPSSPQVQPMMMNMNMNNPRQQAQPQNLSTRGYPNQQSRGGAMACRR